MATPAAVLSILVNANTGKAQAELLGVQKKLAATSKTADATAARSSKAFAAMKLGAGALGVGMLGVGLAARKANREFVEAQKVSRQTNAVLKSTGGAAKVTAREIENLAQKISLKSGIDDEAIQSGANLLLTFKNIRNEAGRGNNIFDKTTRVVTDMSVAMGQSLKSSAIQVGKALNDPVKGITALTRVGVTFSAQQKTQIERLVESGDRLSAQKIILRELNSEFAGSARAQATWSDKLKVAWENLSESVGGLLAPAIRKAQRFLAGFTNDLTAIVGRKDLDFGEKLSAAFDLVSGRLKSLRLGERLAGALEAAIPKLSDAAARAAPRMAEAFVNGFLNAGPWGRLAAGGFLLAKFGGLGAFRAVGGRAGGEMATGMATAGGWKGAASSVGKGLGIAAAIAFLPEWLKNVQEGMKRTTPELGLPKTQQILGNAPLLGETLGGLADDFMNADDKIGQAGQRISETFKKLDEAGDRNGLLRLADQARAAGRQFPHMSGEFNRAATIIETRADEMAPNVARNFREMRQAGGRNLKTIKETAAHTAFQIGQDLGQGSQKGKEALAKNFRLAAGAVRQSMREGRISTKTGLEEIERLMRQSLKMFGITGKQATRYLNKQDTITGKSLDTAGGKQRGGPIFGGAPSGDSIPAMLERGEYVLNRKAVQALGKGTLDRINFGAAPRFQSGGIVELLHPFNDPAGHGGSNSHLHIAHATVAGIVAIGRRLQKMGWLVGEHPAFGGVRSRHDPDGYHYTGQAIDANWPNPGEEGAKIRQVLDMLGGMASGKGGGAPLVDVPKLKRVMMRSGLGALTQIGQAGLDRVRSAAQERLKKIAGSFAVEGAETGIGGKGSGKALMQSIAKARGWNFADWWEIDRRETGHGANLVNPTSTARLRGQFLDMNWGKYGIGSDPRRNPSMDEQIRSMAAYIAERYGNPSAALAHHNAHNWYQRGGKVGGHGSGDRVPALLEPGEFVIPRKIMQGFSNGGFVTGTSTGNKTGTIPSINPTLLFGSQGNKLPGGTGWTAGSPWGVGQWDSFLGQFAPLIAQVESTPWVSDDIALFTQITEALPKAISSAVAAGDWASADKWMADQTWAQGVLSGLQNPSTDTGIGEDPNQALIDAQNQAAAWAQALAEELAAVRKELADDRKWKDSVGAVQVTQISRALADMMSGEIVGRGVVPRSALPSSGSLASY